MSKSRITYRFELPQTGNNTANKAGPPSGRVIPLYDEEFKVVEDQQGQTAHDSFGMPAEEDAAQGNSGGELIQFTSDFGEWRSPFDAETRRIERLIRESDKQPEYSSSRQNRRNPSVQYDVRGYDEAPPYDFEHLIVPQTVDVDVANDQMAHLNPQWYDTNWSRTRISRSVKPPWITVILSAGGAIAAGLLLGFFVLNMFSDGLDGNKAPTHMASNDSGTNGGINPLPNHAANPQGSLPDQAEMESKDVTGAAMVSTVDVQLPERIFSLLQIGVFSTQQIAQSMMDQLAKQGLAAVSERVGANYAVYAGVTTNRDHALLLSGKLDSKVPEIYAKNMTIPQTGLVSWIGSRPEILPNYLSTGDQLIQDLIQLSIVHINEAKPTLPDESDLQSIRQVHLTWTSHAAAVGSGVSDVVKPLLQKMNAAMNTAMISLDEYKKSPDTSYLWKIQEEILKYIVSEKQLIAAIATS